MCFDAGADYLSFNSSVVHFYLYDMGNLNCLSFLICKCNEKLHNVAEKIKGVNICHGHKALPCTE